MKPYLLTPVPSFSMGNEYAKLRSVEGSSFGASSPNSTVVKRGGSGLSKLLGCYGTREPPCKRLAAGMLRAGVSSGSFQRVSRVRGMIVAQ